MTLQQTDVTAPVYWRQPFEPLATVSDLVEFVILDIEPSGPVRGKYVLADAQITRASTSTRRNDDDGMGDDGIYHTRTHIGAILQPGDTVLGYHLTKTNFNNEAFESLDQGRIPDVILVKKTYPNRRKKARARNWQLRSIAKEAEDAANDSAVVGRGALGRRGGVDQKNVERDYELFLRDLEEDKEMRAAINLYRVNPAAAKDGAVADITMSTSTPGSGLRGGKKRGGKRTVNGADVEMGVEGPTQGDGQGRGYGQEDDTYEGGHDGDDESGEDEEEDDFPEVEMDELLEHFEEMDMSAEDGEEVL